MLARCAELQVDGWNSWNALRLLCDQNPRLQVCLELTEDLPETDRELHRWLAEPVRSVIIPTDAFLTNKQGFPVLSKRHKAFLLQLFRNKVQVILQGLPEGAKETETEKYLHYVARLFQSRPAPTAQEQFETPYHDWLQAPLQPLQDNLESQTYETFEKDPVKCRTHGTRTRQAMVVGAGRGPLVVAVGGAQVKIWAVEKNPNAVVTLRHRCAVEEWTNVEVIGEDMRFWDAPRKADLIVSELLGSFGDNELSPECLDGAGPRQGEGPPPRTEASVGLGVFFLILIEPSFRLKPGVVGSIRSNPSDSGAFAVMPIGNLVVANPKKPTMLCGDHRAVRFLLLDGAGQQKTSTGQSALDVAQAANEQGSHDVVIDLLKMPSAQRFLEPDGACIPSKYTSSLTPVTTHKLWNDVKNYNDLAHFETAYVVKFHQAFYPTSQVEKCFEFSHPNWELSSNDRYAQIEFTSEVDALVHGFAGYFHCELYAGLSVSINPESYSEGMFSWSGRLDGPRFPIYFPLRTPVNLKRGEKLTSSGRPAW
ncbi:unnamed protein product [Durusdinium trenchii]|uniref:Protein arginine N-methyltransferase n=1 Tax=Durusdinium trenchii TaxID=1381693 RepID=A0ABP0MK72_9DINO